MIVANNQLDGPIGRKTLDYVGLHFEIGKESYD